MRKTECPNCSGKVNDNVFCEKCGLSFERAINLQRAKRADRFSTFALILSIVALIFS